MAGIPVNFQAISNVLPTYQFIDIAAGTGIIKFYAGNTVDLKLLSNHTYYSDEVKITSARLTSATYAKELDLDFDVVLNRPLSLRGKIVVNVPFMLYHDDSTIDGDVKVRVRKWDGSTET